MKKTLGIFILLSIVTPSIALAAWWNPFSWFDNFSNKPDKQEEKTEVLEKKIQELEKRIESANIEDVDVSEMIDKEIIVEEQEQEKVIEKKHETVTCQGKTYLDDCSNSGRIFACGSDTGMCLYQYEIDNLLVCNGTTYSKCTAGVFTCPATGNAYCSTSNNSFENTVSDYLNEIDKREEDRKVEEMERRNSPECVSAKKDYDRITKKMEKNREESKNVEIATPESRKLNSEAADLAVESLPIKDQYYLVCEDYVRSPSPTYNTSCTTFGNTTNCSTY